MLVDSIAQGLAHTKVAEGLKVIIKIEGLDDVAAALKNSQLREVRDLAAGKALGHINGAGAQAHHHSLPVGDNL